MSMTSNRISVANLFNDSTVYVIPTFQRPYAWAETQWSELVEDLRVASNKTHPYHYFAPIHILEIPDCNSGLWKDYTDSRIEDIRELTGSNFSNAAGNLNVFFVIDGQQRLITLYSLLHQYYKRNIGIGVFSMPSVILNSPEDQLEFRNLLALPSGSVSSAAKNPSKAQGRLRSLFAKFSSLTTKDPCFVGTSGKCTSFLRSNDCEILCVKLTGSSRLAAFMTLNDRGKALTNLEKAKSLFMEIDDNLQNPCPKDINHAFGGLYQSIEASSAYIDDDKFLQQLGMRLWEGVNLSRISGVSWPVLKTGKPRNNSIHQVGAETLYEDYFKKLPASIAETFLRNEIVPSIIRVTESNNCLTSYINQAQGGGSIGSPSCATRLGFGPRDAIEDYFSVLLSIGLQAKQIGFLFGAFQLFPSLMWHDILGTCKFDNQKLKSELLQVLSQIRVMNQNFFGIEKMTDSVEEEIRSIPDDIEREYSALQVAEALRLFVENTKPGGYSGTWNATYGPRTPTSIAPQDFLNHWWHYICSYDSRIAFIISIARGTNSYNNTPWVKYLLKEYEYCLSRNNAHRNARYEIEHFFPAAWGCNNQSMLKNCGFTSLEQYNSSFVEQIGNKLVLDEGLNRALKDQDIPVRVSAYQKQAYGSISVVSSNSSQSAVEIGNQLSGMGCAEYRVYVQLRSLRLAIFAASRF